MKMKEEKISREIIYKGHVVTLVRDKVLCPNGQEAYREIVQHNGGAAILCITKDKKIILIRQFRYAYDEVIYEIPAGKLEIGENPKDAALREFEEETGNKAKDIEFLTVIYPTCGYDTEKIYLYLVQDFEKTETHFDEDEVIETEYVDYDRVLEMIDKGEIKDAKTICAIMAYQIRYGG